MRSSEEWEYISIVVMLLYLAVNTCPYISYAVHPCASYFHNLKRGHEIVVKQIVRYLRVTRNKGLIMNLDRKKFRLDLFVDADFAGLFASENRDNIISFKSRTGILLTFGTVTIC